MQGRLCDCGNDSVSVLLYRKRRSSRGGSGDGHHVVDCGTLGGSAVSEGGCELNGLIIQTLLHKHRVTADIDISPPGGRELGLGYICVLA